MENECGSGDSPFYIYSIPMLAWCFISKVVHAESGIRLRVRFRPARHRITELSYLPKLE